MAFFARNNNTNETFSERQNLERKYAQSRNNILLVVLFETAENSV